MNEKNVDMEDGLLGALMSMAMCGSNDSLLEAMQMNVALHGVLIAAGVVDENEGMSGRDLIAKANEFIAEKRPDLSQVPTIGNGEEKSEESE